MSAQTPDPKDRGPIETSTYFPSATRLDSATPVILQPGEHREQVDIRVARDAFYCVDGKIEVSGKPESASFAILESALAGTQLARVRSSAAEDGAFHVCGLSPGAYRLSTDEGFTDFAVSSFDVDRVKLSTERAQLRLQVDWDGDAPPPPKLDEAAKATVRKIAANMGWGDALGDADLEKQAVRLSSPEGPDVVAVGDAVMQMGRNEATRGEISYLMGFLHPHIVGGLSSTGNGGGPGFGAAIPYSGPINFFKPSATDVPAGDYVVDIQASGPSNPYVKRVEYNQLPLAGGQMQLSPGASGTLHVVVATGIATLGVSVADGDGKPVGNANIVVIPDGVTSIAALSRLAVRGQTDQNGSYTSRPLPPGKYRVLATTQTIRWGVPEDLEKMLLVLFQAKEVELAAKDLLQITLEPVPF